MARKYDQQYEDTQEWIRNHSTEGTHQARKGVERTHLGYEDAEDVEHILTMADVYNIDNFVVDCPEGQSMKSVTILRNYLTSLNKIALYVALTDTTMTELNTVTQGFLDGDLHDMRDSGLLKGSIHAYQNALRQFYYICDDVGVDPEGIIPFKVDDKAVDPMDMLTCEEIQAIRGAADCMRDRTLFDSLIYTGQRNTATRSLRIKGLDLENNRFQLNTDADGLKGAETNRRWWGLLLSSVTVKQYPSTEHPVPGDPETYVFMSRPKYGGPKSREMLDVATPSSIVGRLADRAAEDYPAIASKPAYPHALRHNFVTIALHRGMDETAIKYQIGRAPNSSVMELTYAHLKDSDHIWAVWDVLDLETEDHESELMPEVRPRCGKSPPGDARFCPYCGLAFTPDVEQAVKDAEETVNDSYRQTPPEDAGTREKIDLVYNLLDDPDVKAAIAERKAEGQCRWRWRTTGSAGRRQFEENTDDGESILAHSRYAHEKRPTSGPRTPTNRQNTFYPTLGGTA